MLATHLSYFPLLLDLSHSWVDPFNYFSFVSNFTFQWFRSWVELRVNHFRLWRQKSQWGFPSLGMVWPFHEMKNSFLWRCHGLLGLSFVGFMGWCFLMFFGWCLVMVMGSIPILGEPLIFIYNFIILIQ